MTEDTTVYTAIAKRILKTTGKDSSREAAKTLAEYMEEQGIELAEKATVFSEHAGRHTIRKEDIEAALKEL